MAKIVFPAKPWTEGQRLAHGDLTLVFKGGSWVPEQQYTGGGSGGGGGLTEGEVATIVDQKITAVDVDGKISTAITALELGNLSKSDMIVSNQPPDNQIGKNGDLWIQTP